MKIIKPSVKKVIFYIPEDGQSIEQSIEETGRNCYKSEGKITPDSADKFVRMLRNRGHEAMLEFGYARVHISADRGLCYDDKTEVLTYDGWKFFKDVKNSDSFLTTNMSTGKSSYQKSLSKTIEDWNGDLICGKSTMVDFAVTPNHRMVWFHYDSRIDKRWRIDKAEKIEGRRVKFQRGLFNLMNGKPVPKNFPKQDTISFARFMGMFITDGSLWRGLSESGTKLTGGRVTLSQTKPKGRKYIEKFLKDLGWKYTEYKNNYRINNSKLYEFLRKDFPINKKKHLVGRVPKWIRHAPPDYIKAFLEGAVMGNGSIDKKNNHEVIYTASYNKAGDFQELYMKIGLCASIRIDDRIGEKHKINGNIIKKTIKTYIVSVTKRTNEHLFNKKHWFRKQYNGKVYCVTVPNGTLYVRRNGKSFWSGNTHELVRHRVASFAQESTRYCNYSKGRFDSNITVIEQPGIPTNLENGEIELSEISQVWTSAMETIEYYYMKLLELGVKPEIARSVLPIGIKSDIVISANLREWRHIFRLRCSSKAHPIIRGIMLECLEKFHEKIPSVYEDLAKEFLISSVSSK